MNNKENNYVKPDIIVRKIESFEMVSYSMI